MQPLIVRAVTGMKTVVFDRDQLRGMLRDFTLLTGIRISFWDTTGAKRIYSSDREDSAYCTWLQTVPQLHQACHQCDKQLLDRALKEKRTIRVRCHADLEECATPLIVEGELLGFFMIGQTRVEGGAQTRWAQHWFDRYGLNPDTTKALFWQLPSISTDAQRSAERMLEAIAISACSRGYIKAARLSLVSAFENYIAQHPTEPLTLDEVCGALQVSRSTLCKCLREQLGTSFVSYVNGKRVEQAIPLLKRGMPVAEAADAVGFSSASYFSKVFKGITGSSPKHYSGTLL